MIDIQVSTPLELQTKAKRSFTITDMALTHVKSRHDIWTSTQRSQGIGDLVSVLKPPVKLREGSFEALIDTAMCGILEVSPSSNEPHISRQSPSCSQVNCKSELLMKVYVLIAL